MGNNSSLLHLMQKSVRPEVRGITDFYGGAYPPIATVSSYALTTLIIFRRGREGRDGQIIFWATRTPLARRFKCSLRHGRPQGDGERVGARPPPLENKKRASVTMCGAFQVLFSPCGALLAPFFLYGGHLATFSLCVWGGGGRGSFFGPAPPLRKFLPSQVIHRQTSAMHGVSDAGKCSRGRAFSASLHPVSISCG